MPTVREARDTDFDAAFALLDERSRRVGDGPLDRAWIRRPWARQAKWVAEDGGRIVGYAALGKDELTHVAADAAAAEALLAAAEDRARGRNDERVEITVVHSDVALTSLLRRSGYTQQREILRMWRRLGDEPAPPAVDGIEVRTHRNGDAERVHALLDDAYAGWDDDYTRMPHDTWLQWMTQHDDFDPELWFLAEGDGELVGCALHWGARSGYGWVKDIVVREDVRGNGLGRVLLEHGFHSYAQRDVPRVGLKVDGNNPTGALRLYERAGFETDIAYGVWTKAL
jgi:ribosomal protein S18 acetylase RimI-like enzyme